MARKKAEPTTNLPAIPADLAGPPILTQAQRLRIVDEPTRIATVDLLHEAASRRERIEDILEPLVKNAHRAWKSLTEFRSNAVAPLLEAEGLCKAALLADQIAKEQERRARERAAEAERQAALEAERERRMQEAGEDIEAQAEAISLDVDDVVPAFADPPDTEDRTDGVAFVTNYSGECTSILDLCRAVIDGRAPESYVMPDMAVINATIRAQKDSFACPGIGVVRTQSVKRAA